MPEMQPDGDLLRRAAERASLRDFYLAASLLAFARAERFDDDALAAALGCGPADLPALLLCRRPTGGGAVFRQDVEAIAKRFGLDAARLARAVRAGDVHVALSRAPDTAGGLLAAARDRHEAPPTAPHGDSASPPPSRIRRTERDSEDDSGRDEGER
ncbi:MAG: hypothetical protein IT305_31090 [Chloroflexi bacterium]|nr:hypothetical protein [Chloroflexota bacterium]